MGTKVERIEVNMKEMQASDRIMNEVAHTPANSENGGLDDMHDMNLLVQDRVRSEISSGVNRRLGELHFEKDMK